MLVHFSEIEYGDYFIHKGIVYKKYSRKLAIDLWGNVLPYRGTIEWDLSNMVAPIKTKLISASAVPVGTLVLIRGVVGMYMGKNKIFCLAPSPFIHYLPTGTYICTIII